MRPAPGEPAHCDLPALTKTEASSPEPPDASDVPGWWTSVLPPAGPDPRFDTSWAHPARVYGYWLGGKDHYEADRRTAEEVIRLRPQVVASARANRAFLARVVPYLANDCGIRQFLDIGTGLPGQRGSNTHEVAQQVDPACRVVYVDNDPLVMTHARALLTSTPQGTCDHIDGDLREPETILAEAAKALDFTQPTAILLLAVAHFLTDRDRPAEIVTTLASALAPGSFLAISHLTADLAPEPIAGAVTAYNTQAPVPVTARTHARSARCLAGCRCWRLGWFR
jgi:S-adenosyl methyltransferase